TRSSGRLRRPHRTGTSPAPCRPSTADPTSTRPPSSRRTISRRRDASSRRWPPPPRTDRMRDRVTGITPAVPWMGAVVRQRAADYFALTKPRVVMMVLVTTLVGYYLGTEGAASLVRLLHTLLGTALAAGGTLALNQYLERDLDARMERTRRRPLPDG